MARKQRKRGSRNSRLGGGLAVVLVAVACGSLAGWLVTLGNLPVFAALCAALGAVLGALLFGLTHRRADAQDDGGTDPLRVPPLWLAGLVCFAGAAFLCAFAFAPEAPQERGPAAHEYPSLTELLELDQATPDELALLYQVRWSLMARGVAVSEMKSFFQNVVGELRRTHLEERVAALRHVLINVDAGAAGRLAKASTPAAAPQDDLPRGFMPPPAGSCGGTCGNSSRPPSSGQAAIPAPVPGGSPVPGGGASCGAPAASCGGGKG